MQEETEYINVYGARVHNLKNIDAEIPRNSLTVITGLSGSGKSSLAFDTIFAEGQRRYIETFSAYARNFLGNLERPDVDKITGLSPVISIEQKTTNKNPRSTVGTTTEVYDYLRLLYARAGDAYSYLSGEKMVKYTEEQILDLILKDYKGKRIYILAPLVRGRKGHYKELFEQVRKKGYLYVRVDGEVREALPGMKLDRYKNHDVEVVIDKLVVADKDDTRLKNSVATAMRQGDGLLMILDAQTDSVRHYSKRLMCPVTGLSYREPAPHNFSFNSPQGACPKCKGLGVVSQIDIDKVIPDRELSIAGGAIAPLGKAKNSMIFWQITALLEKYEATLKTPVKELPEDALDEVLYGSDERIKIKSSLIGTSSDYFVTFEGVIKYIQMLQEKDASATAQKWADQFAKTAVCPECHGAKLNKEALSFRIHDKNIYELSTMDISELYDWLSAVDPHLSSKQQQIAGEILKEIRTRLKFLLDVGLDYLSLNRSSVSLSGGESQRINLATSLGSSLVGSLYILDEPSIGLHSRDTDRLLHVLRQLQQLGNTVVVVEHDEEIIRATDYIIDIGPNAGRLGGEVVYQGDMKDLKKGSNSYTVRYLLGEDEIPVPKHRRPWNNYIELKGARENNLKGVNVRIPLNVMTVVTGVSGSGKSTLVRDIFFRALKRELDECSDRPGEFTSIGGSLRDLRNVEFVDQNPIGKSSRSNPVTYIKAYDEIRKLWSEQPLAKQMGYTPGFFSFNSEGGRCEECKGEGTITVEMQFMADLVLECESCHGKRFKSDTLEVKFNDKSIYDVLEMTVNQAIEFFNEHGQKKIVKKLLPLQDVGLGYIKLGQASSTLSGGENQRVKLAFYLSQEKADPTMFIFDEPTTGLHFHDIRKLLDAFDALIRRGHSIVIIEHNMDVIKCADYVIDLGPEGGDKGGNIVAVGTPEEVAACGASYTGQFLKEKLG